jgi:hypothetical protein
VLSAKRAIRIFPILHLLKGHVQSIEKEKPSRHGLSDAQDFLERLIGLKKADDSGNCPQNSGFLAVGNEAGRRRFRKKTTITWPPGVRFERTQLPIVTENGS